MNWIDSFDRDIELYFSGRRRITTAVFVIVIAAAAFMRVSIISGRWPCLNWHFFCIENTNWNEKLKTLVLNSFDGWTRNKLINCAKLFAPELKKYSKNNRELKWISLSMCVCVFMCVYSIVFLPRLSYVPSFDVPFQYILL